MFCFLGIKCSLLACLWDVVCPQLSQETGFPCRAGFVLEVGALAENKDRTRCIGLESKEVLRGEAEDTRRSPHVRA